MIWEWNKWDGITLNCPQLNDQYYRSRRERATSDGETSWSSEIRKWQCSMNNNRTWKSKQKTDDMVNTMMENKKRNCFNQTLIVRWERIIFESRHITTWSSNIFIFWWIFVNDIMKLLEQQMPFSLTDWTDNHFDVWVKKAFSPFSTSNQSSNSLIQSYDGSLSRYSRCFSFTPSVSE
jgi:hypothetical protein